MAGAASEHKHEIITHTVDKEQLKGAREELSRIIEERKCHPIFVRLGWHDSGSYNKDITEWPRCQGTNGSIKYEKECRHGCNAGLDWAVKVLEDVKAKFPGVSYADLYQLASATAIETAGGPKIPMRYGRQDVASEDDVAIEGNLPAGAAPFPGAHSAAEHLRNVFYRMGFNDQEIVALSGAHTIGRAHATRSGLAKPSCKYTENLPNGQTQGGQPWTKEWHKFDNSYFVEAKEKNDPELLCLETDSVLFEDPEFRKSANKYAADQDSFFHDYALAHAKLSELGAKWVEGAPITLDA